MRTLRYLRYFFTVQGRLNRARYLSMAGMTALLVGMTYSMTIEQPDRGELVFGMLVAWALCVPISIMASVRRLHDLNRPGAHYFLLFVPIYNIYLGCRLLFEKGSAGTNRYGDDPLVVLACPQCSVSTGRQGDPAWWEIYLAFQTIGLAIPFLALRDFACRDCGHRWRRVGPLSPAPPVSETPTVRLDGPRREGGAVVAQAPIGTSISEAVTPVPAARSTAQPIPTPSASPPPLTRDMQGAKLAMRFHRHALDFWQYLRIPWGKAIGVLDGGPPFTVPWREDAVLDIGPGWHRIEIAVDYFGLVRAACKAVEDFEIKEGESIRIEYTVPATISAAGIITVIRS